MENNTYVVNRETGKLELCFTKEEYQALSDELKSAIRRNFLFSGKRGAWVSRAKFPHLHYAEEVAKKLGFTDGGKIGEQLTFAEQMERKAERALQRAERYDERVVNAVNAGEALQKPINDMHGDIAFFTQPNINTSSGRAFTRRRDKMFAAWERGFEEFKKSEYYAERAAAARETAAKTKPTDKAFCDRRIKEAEKTIRAQQTNLSSYKEKLERIQKGEILKRYNGVVLTKADVEKWIEDAEMIIEDAISKAVYYHDCLEELGGVSFSIDNIKKGYIVDITRWGKCRVLGTGKVNISYEILTGGAKGLGGKAAYAEIRSIISTEASMPVHPFKVGDTYTVNVWDGKKYSPKEYTVIKVTDEKVTIKSGTERALTKKPRRIRDRDGYSWALGISDGYNGPVYKKEDRVESVGL